jgi:hypothetical protein
MSEIIELEHGYTASITFNPDDIGTPWEWEDGHGPVSEWTMRGKRPGEWVLCTDRHGSKRYYDAKAAQAIALRDGWNTKDKSGTARQQAARAVLSDYSYLRAWCNSDWEYVLVDAELLRHGHTVAKDCLAGVESFKYYHHECALGMATKMMHADIQERTERLALRKREHGERRYWATRDVVTAP